jgi:hypothetical protein
MGDREFRRITEETIIVKSTVLEQLELARDDAIRIIMRIVDNHTSGDAHRFIRSAVLDSINEMYRSNASVLERLLEKING